MSDEMNTGLLEAAEELVYVQRHILGKSREETKAMMVHPDDEKNEPGLIFNALWPEGT